MAANLVENLGREDLTSYEVAMQCARLRKEMKVDNADIAKMIRGMNATEGGGEGKKPLSETHINNLVRCVEALHPQVLKAWSEEHPRASVRVLIKLSAQKDKEKQLKEWRVVCGEAEEDEGETDLEDGPVETPPARAARPTSADIKVMLERIQESDHSEEWLAGATIGLRWACGDLKKIPGVKLTKPAKGPKVDPDETEDEIDDEDAA